MSLHQLILKDMKLALKTQNREKLDVLRLLVSEFQRRSNPHQELSDKEVVSIINKMIKSEQDLLKYKNENTSTFIDILSEYLPKQLSKLELIDILNQKYSDILTMNKSDRIRKMGMILKDLGTSVDGKLLKEVLMEI